MEKLPHDFYEKYGEQWSNTERRDIERMDTGHKIERMCEILKGYEPKSIVDVGCGLGDALHLLSQRFNTSQAVGIDVSSAMLQTAKKEYPELTFIHGTVDDVKKFEVDLITFFDVLEHLEDIPATLASARQNAKYIAVKIPLEKTWLIAALNFLKLKEEKSSAFESEGHLYEFNRREVDRLLQHANLKIVRAKRHFVMKREFLFSDLIGSRMKRKPGVTGKSKYIAYRVLSFIPFGITSILMRPVLGDDYYVLCQS